MTKMKKTFITVSFAASVMLAGAGFLLLPHQSIVSADEGDGLNGWIVTPRFYGGEFGGFTEEDLFVAVPKDGAIAGDAMRFSFTDGSGKLCGTYYATVDRADNSLTYYEDSGAVHEVSTESILSILNGWAPDEYTMTVNVSAGGNASQGLEATVPFRISKAKNYWTTVPGIMNWYQDEPDFIPAPYGEAKFGGAPSFTVNFLEEDSNGNYIPDGKGGYQVDYGTNYSVGELPTFSAGTYALVAEVASSDNWEGLSSVVFFRIFESKSQLAALAEARETAAEELREFTESLGLIYSEIDPAVRNVFDGASSVKAVGIALEGAKVSVYKVYAAKRINQTAEEYGMSQTQIDAAVGSDMEMINSAGDLQTVKTTLESALGKIYDEGVGIEKINIKSKVQREATSDSQTYGISVAYDEVTMGREIDNAKTFEELEDAYRHARVLLMEKAISGADETNYEAVVKEAIERYAIYVGVKDSALGGEATVQLYKDRVEAASSKQEADAIYENTAKPAIDGILSNEQSVLLQGLTDAIGGYMTRYPETADELKEILENAHKTMSEIPTLLQSQTTYNRVLADINECVLDIAIERAIEELLDAVKTAGIGNFDTESVIAMLENAEDITDVESILQSALKEIGSALYDVRIELITELEALAQTYSTDYNWRVILNAVTAGKDGINAAPSYSDIYEKYDEAALGLVYAYVLAELDYLGSLYADYDVAAAVEDGKTALGQNHDEDGFYAVLDDAKDKICVLAKKKAVENLTSFNDYYRAWDRSEAENAITSAATVEKVDELYRQAYDQLMQLVNERASAISSAQAMLRVYAENLGVEYLSEVTKAINDIAAAQTSAEVPYLFDQAKAQIERAAEAEQQRITASNKAAIAFSIVFALTTAGLGAALGWFLYQKYGKKKKGGKKPPKNETPKQTDAPQQAPAQTFTAQQMQAPQQAPAQTFTAQQMQAPQQAPAQTFTAQQMQAPQQAPAQTFTAQQMQAPQQAPVQTSSQEGTPQPPYGPSAN